MSLPAKLLTVLVMIAGCCLTQIVNAQGMGIGTPEGREITHVTGDLYRFRDSRHFASFLVTPEGIILVDTTNPDAAAWLKEQVAERFGVPVKYVIYTHAHNDHAGGGEAFADTATFIGHENMRNNLTRPADDAPLLPREQVWDTNGDGQIQEAESEGTAVGNNFARWDADGSGGLIRAEIWAARFTGAPVVAPDLYYSDHATITLGGKSVELHYTGRNHSDDMTVVLFPEERVIHTVDFLTPNRLPRSQLDGGYFPEWLASLRKVEQLDFDIIAPGHESPGTKAHVSEQVRYMEDLLSGVTEGIAAGKTEEELVETLLLEDYDHLVEYEFSRARNVSGVYESLIATGAN